MSKRTFILGLALAAASVLFNISCPAAAETGVRINAFDGHLHVERKGKELRVKPAGDNILQEGDTVVAEDDADIAVVMHDFAGFEVVGLSNFKVIKNDRSRTEVYFKTGAPIFNVRSIPTGTELILETAVVSVRAAKSLFYISTNTEATTVCVSQGEVFIVAKESGSSLKITAGFCVDAANDDSIAQVRPMTAEDELSLSEAKRIATSS